MPQKYFSNHKSVKSRHKHDARIDVIFIEQIKFYEKGECTQTTVFMQ